MSRVVCVALIGIAFYFVYNEIVLTRSVDILNENYGEISTIFSAGTILFTGDIMLGRVVERIIEEHRFLYPFLDVASFINAHDIAVGNFEGAIPKKHVATPPNGMRFSVLPESMNELHALGFDILSLANNHAFDFGISGYANTLAICSKASLICAGNSFSVSTSSLYITHVGNVRVGIIFLHTLFNEPTEDELAPLLRALSGKSDVQIAYIHWGEEYQKQHSAEQEKLAYSLIDNGVDAVVGHHPHVIQDIEKYKGKPIFYSLGNFIFDQYFSDAVQEGYLLSITARKDELTYSLSPYSSTSTPSQPHLMNEINGLAFGRDVLSASFFTNDEILTRSFSVSRD